MYANSAIEQTSFDLKDMDLIEVLWRQDIDLGVGREMFDSSLRLEAEKEFELEQKKQAEESEKKKEKKPEEECDSFAMLDLSGNYIIDGETGEIVSGPMYEPDQHGAMDFADFSEMLLSNTPQQASLDPISVYDNLLPLNQLSSLEQLPPLEQLLPLELPPPLEQLPPLELPPPMEQLPLLGQLDNLEALFQPRGTYEELQVMQGTGASESMPHYSSEMLSRQNSLEETWNDVLGMLNLPDYSRSNATHFSPDSLMQNVSMDNLNFTDSLSQSYTTRSMSLFPEIDLNGTYHASSLNVATTTNMSSVINSFPETNTSFLNMNPTPVHQLDTSSIGNHESTDVSDLSPTTLESIFRLIDDFNHDPADVANLQLPNEYMGLNSVLTTLVSPTLQWGQNVDQSDGVDEATGGKDVSACEVDFDKCEYNPDPRFRSASPRLEVNSSVASNDTSLKSSKVPAKHIYHNHTYVLQPGQVSREEREEALKREKEQKATRSRDEKKAKEMKLPFSIDDIINTPVEDFTHMLSKYSLSEAQHQLIRDIRRRGKNKQAAQNCRKRKLGAIQTLEEQVAVLNRDRSSLLQERRYLDRETSQLKDKFVRLQTELFRSLRDENGRPYNPNDYSLQQLPDGNIFLVPKSNSTEQVHAEKPGRKRKPKRKE